MDKKYPEPSAETSSSVKERTGSEAALPEPRYATAEMMEKAVSEVMKIHGEALRKLAQ